MPFKHTVTDSRGNVHTRTSENRQYAFAAVVHMPAYDRQDGQGQWPARSFANWSSTEKLARASNRRYGAVDTEIVPCTPVPTGRHAVKADTRNADRIDGYDRDDLGESHD